MKLTLAITRNAPDRYRGFLRSCMLEIAPGTYCQLGMHKAVRERVWATCCAWANLLGPDASILLLWPDKAYPGNLGMLTLGIPKHNIVEHDEMWLVQHT